MSVRRNQDIENYHENWKEFNYDFGSVRYAPYGGKRRKALMELFERGMIICVNGKHVPHTDKDPDLKRLLKEGKIEMITANPKMYSDYAPKFKRTYVRIKDGRTK